MDVVDNKLKRSLKDPKQCRRRYGVPMAKKLRLRLDALEAAESLADFWPPHSGPERCHELKGDLAGAYSMDVNQPYRLVFRATDDSDNPPNSPYEDKADGKQRWMTLREIMLISVEDTHD